MNGLDRHNQIIGPPVPTRPLEDVPHDLLTDQERRTQIYEGHIWLRTDYGPGTDERHRELLGGYDEDLQGPLGSLQNIFDDSSRYDFAESEDPQALYAFFPGLLTVKVGPYLEWDTHLYASEEVQEDLFPSFMPEKTRQRVSQDYFFVADREAMRTGYLNWFQPDQYGRPWQQNRIQPWSLYIVCVPYGEELRDECEDGYIPELGWKEDEKLVYPWESPQS